MKRAMVSLVLLLFICSGCTAVVYVEVTPAPTFTPTIAPTERAITAAPAPTESAVSEQELNLDPDTILSSLRYGLEDTNDTKYEIEYNNDGNVYIVYVTSSGLAVLALSAKTGSATSVEAWDNYLTSLCNLNSAMLNYIQVLGSDASFSFIVRNDSNPENTLASTLNSVVVYDVTKE